MPSVQLYLTELTRINTTCKSVILNSIQYTCSDDYIPAKIKYPSGECPNPSENLLYVDYSFGTLNIFYSIAQGWSREMRAKLNTEDIDKLTVSVFKLYNEKHKN